VGRGFLTTLPVGFWVLFCNGFILRAGVIYSGVDKFIL
jgi:hypothetical protein